MVFATRKVRRTKRILQRSNVDLKEHVEPGELDRSSVKCSYTRNVHSRQARAPSMFVVPYSVPWVDSLGLHPYRDYRDGLRRWRVSEGVVVVAK